MTGRRPRIRPAPRADTPGFGLTGLGERVNGAGGTFRAGWSAHGFTVEAVLSIEPVGDSDGRVADPRARSPTTSTSSGAVCGRSSTRNQTCEWSGRQPTGRRQRARPSHRRADVVLMDVQMPGVDGIEGVRLVIEARPEARVLMLTMFDLDDYVLRALRAGASGFLLKTTPPADLTAAIRASRNGDDAVRSVRHPPPGGVLRETARPRWTACRSGLRV